MFHLTRLFSGSSPFGFVGHKPGGSGGGGGGPILPDAPILAFQAGHVAGTNPMSWQSTYNNSIEWDGAGNGDKVGARWRVNGGAWTNETEQVLDAAALLNQGFQWPLFEAASPFAAGALVEVEEWKSRYVANVLTGTSAFSNDLSDTMAIPPFAPSSLYGAGDIGYAFDVTDRTKMFQDNGGATNLVGAANGTVLGRLQDISGKARNLNSVGNDTTRPTWSAALNGGLITFDGVNDRLLGAGGIYAKGAMTWIGVVKGAAQSNFIWAEDASGSGNPVYAPGLRGDDATHMYNYLRNDAGTVTLHAMLLSLLDGNPHMYVVVDTGTQVKISLDGGAFVTDAYVRSGTLSSNQSSLGVADVAGTQFSSWNGQVGSLIVISRVLAGTLSAGGGEITNAYNWVAAKHGLTQL